MADLVMNKLYNIIDKNYLVNDQLIIYSYAALEIINIRSKKCDHNLTDQIFDYIIEQTDEQFDLTFLEDSSTGTSTNSTNSSTSGSDLNYKIDAMVEKDTQMLKDVLDNKILNNKKSSICVVYEQFFNKIDKCEKGFISALDVVKLINRKDLIFPTNFEHTVACLLKHNIKIDFEIFYTYFIE
jgi:hypothetical protein